jgi:hypothetical protein
VAAVRPDRDRLAARAPAARGPGLHDGRQQRDGRRHRPRRRRRAHGRSRSGRRASAALAGRRRAGARKDGASAGRAPHRLRGLLRSQALRAEGHRNALRARGRPVHAADGRRRTGGGATLGHGEHGRDRRAGRGAGGLRRRRDVPGPDRPGHLPRSPRRGAGAGVSGPGVQRAGRVVPADHAELLGAGPEFEAAARPLRRRRRPHQRRLRLQRGPGAAEPRARGDGPARLAGRVGGAPVIRPGRHGRLHRRGLRAHPRLRRVAARELPGRHRGRRRRRRRPRARRIADGRPDALRRRRRVLLPGGRRNEPPLRGDRPAARRRSAAAACASRPSSTRTATATMRRPPGDCARRWGCTGTASRPSTAWAGPGTPGGSTSVRCISRASRRPATPGTRPPTCCTTRGACAWPSSATP